MNRLPEETFLAEDCNRLRGDLTLMSASDLLRWIELRNKTGTLTLVNGIVRKTLTIEQGQLVGLVTNRREESQEHILAGAGFLAEDQLVAAQRQSQEQGIPLSRYLLGRKLLEPPALKRLQTFRLLLALADVLRWETGFFILQEMEQAPPGGRLVRLTIGESLEHAQRLNRQALEDQRKYQDSQFQILSQRLRAGDFSIPPMPKTLYQLRQAINDPKGTAHDVLKIVMADQVLTSKILQVVNSSFYSLANPVTSVQHAIVMVGFKSLLGIVIVQSLTYPMGKDHQRVVQLMRHSFKCAYVAKRLAEVVGEDEEIAFVCGLLHDIGKIVLYRLLTEYGLDEVIQEKLLADYHTQAGTLLATQWKLPEPVIAAITLHHAPDCPASDNRMAGIVCLANRLVNDGQLSGLDTPLFAKIVTTIDVAGIVEELRQIETFVDSIF